jgi:Glutaredoxin-like domain (DUF836)
MVEAGSDAAVATAPLLTLMTRLDCSLCTSFEIELAAWEAGRGRFQLAVVNVDSSAELIARYGLRVPVLLVGDEEICAFRLRVERVAAALDAI